MQDQPYLVETTTPIKSLKMSTRSHVGIVVDPRGRFPNLPYDSTVERDFLLMLYRENGLKDINVRNMVVNFEKNDGKMMTYIPDISATFDDGMTFVLEVKTLDELLEKIDEWMQKFAAAEKACQKKGYKFEVVTDGLLDRDYLAFLKSLCSIIRANLDIEKDVFYRADLDGEIAKNVRDVITTVPSSRCADVIKMVRHRLKHVGEDVVYRKIAGMIYDGEIEAAWKGNYSLNTVLLGVTPTSERTNSFRRIHIPSWRSYIDKTAITNDDDDAVVHISFEDLPPKIMKLVEMRLQVIKKIREASGSRRKAVVHVAQTAKLHPSTVYDWLQRYQNGSWPALIPKYSKRGRGPFKYSKKMTGLLRKAIEEWKSPGRPSMVGIYRSLCSEISKNGLSGEPKPSLRSFQRMLAKEPNSEIITARHGGDALKRTARCYPSRREKPDHPFHTFQIDHAPLNIKVVDTEEKLLIGTAWLTIVLDAYSRLVLGFYLDVGPGSAISAACALRMAFFPKDNYKFYTKTKNRWDLHALPFQVISDNGPEFISKNYADALERNGIIVDRCPVFTPEGKAEVERFFATVNMAMRNACLPGFIPDDADRKEGRDRQSEACLTLDDLEEFLVRFFVDEYNVRKHSSLGTSPMETYREWKIDHPFYRSITNNHPLYYELLPKTRRSLRSTGIKLFNMIYTSDAFPVIRKRHAGERIALTVYKDPRDIRSIWIRDPDTSIIHIARCVGLDQREVLTEHDARGHAANLRKRGARVDSQSIWEESARRDQEIRAKGSSNQSERRRRERLHRTKSMSETEPPVPFLDPSASLPANQDIKKPTISPSHDASNYVPLTFRILAERKQKTLDK